MNSFIMQIAIILFMTKFVGLVFTKLKMPQIVGALLAGIIIGPSVLNLFSESEYIKMSAQIGVILIMFNAGLETDIKAFKSNFRSSVVIAVFGMLITIGVVTAIASFFMDTIPQSVFIGVIFASSSVSVAVQSLNEMGKLKGLIGQTLINTAIVDDILGIILFSVIISVVDSGKVSLLGVTMTIMSIICFLVFAFIIFWVVQHLFQAMKNLDIPRRRTSIFALAFCFLMSAIAEEFGLSEIIGAYIAGLILCEIKAANYVEHRTDILNYLFFGPIFFASVGLQTDLSGITLHSLGFVVAISFAALLGKTLGCYTGARTFKFTRLESFQISSGMLARLEVSLIVATMGVNSGIISSDYFTPIVLVTIVTCFVTPFAIVKLFSAEEKEEVSA